MTHEFRDLMETAFHWQKDEMVVLATVVALEGSSYRRPGVRMIISQSGRMKGAVSGGCVEKEVLRQSQSVFKEGTPKVMTYDGRFRLGCEGILYVLVEPLEISEGLYENLQTHFTERKMFSCDSLFLKEAGIHEGMGTFIMLEGTKYALSPSPSEPNSEALQCFTQTFLPIFQLYIFGAEHDAVQLCQMATQVGWDVHIIAPPDEEKTIDYFKGARSLATPLFQEVDVSGIDDQTAVMLMSHSLHKDLQYLLQLIHKKPVYLGILGPKHRRERLFSELLNLQPEVPFDFLEEIHGPAGIDIGAESASEIAVSIIAEILSTLRKVNPQPLRNKKGSIHE
ncbi:MAG: XshC-Cox1-family protein [Flavobacteriaceae bacterium]|nr:XshC-Cox1-family protein [Flavobacteriaceae bacterium]|tara:strand:+ start:5557 stop:6570 length:1014 start_codon:yes stop_codon:yes gene_type:complete